MEPVKKSRAPKKMIDYEALYAILKNQPLTFKDIQKLTGLSRTGTSQCITTLTLNYPIWSPEKGVYKICESSDYQTVNPILEEEE